MSLFSLIAVDNFDKARDVAPRDVPASALKTVRQLDEKDELEPWIQAILYDTNRTPHGPSEIADIFTQKLSVKGKSGLAAFILKGKSFPTVRPVHVSHQILRLDRLQDLGFAILAASGNVLDEVKEHFISMVERLQCDYSILDAHDLARLFIAFGFLCPRDGERISGGRCRCGYSPTTRTSNLLQQEALRELVTTHQLGRKAGTIILPTGSGKTRVAAMDVRRVAAQTSVYVAHSHEILESAEEEFLRHFPREDVRRFDRAPTEAELRTVNLITIQSLIRNLDVFENRTVDYLIFDEFHHAAARSYRRTLDALSPAFLLGLTATPFRGDRQDVLRLCGGNIVVAYDLRQGIEFGVLCPYHYYGCFDDIDYSNITYRGTHYDVRDLERALIIPKRDEAIIAKWKGKADGKPTLAFCCSHRHAQRVAASFTTAGITSKPYLSTTPWDERVALREQLRIGDVKVLCVVDVLNEGVDLPFIECLLFLRPTESKRVFFQQFGRGLRRFVGKTICTVIDFIGNFQNAYRVVENLGLEPDEYDPTFLGSTDRQWKEILNLPAGCTVEFDDRVIDIFGNQTLSPSFITSHNIRRILVYLYQRVQTRLGRRPTAKDIDRNSVLGSDIFITAWGSWKAFEAEMGA
jgi:superfamily II DNA or RNA helicase